MYVRNNTEQFQTLNLKAPLVQRSPKKFESGFYLKVESSEGVDAWTTKWLLYILKRVTGMMNFNEFEISNNFESHYFGIAQLRKKYLFKQNQSKLLLILF